MQKEQITAEQIKALRVAHKLTQVDLAELIGTTCAVVSRWENGRSKPRGPATRSLLNLARKKIV